MVITASAVFGSPSAALLPERQQVHRSQFSAGIHCVFSHSARRLGELVGFGVCCTLMSKSFHKLVRLAAPCVVLLQLVLLPATSVLHLGCGQHCGCSAVVTEGQGATDTHPAEKTSAVACPHCRFCQAHGQSTASSTNGRQSDDRTAGDSPLDESDPDHSAPHDSHNCRICQAAFALATAEGFEVCVPVCDFTDTLSCRTESAPALTAAYRCPGRGPPAV